MYKLPRIPDPFFKVLYALAWLEKSGKHIGFRPFEQGWAISNVERDEDFGLGVFDPVVLLSIRQASQHLGGTRRAREGGDPTFLGAFIALLDECIAVLEKARLPIQLREQFALDVWNGIRAVAIHQLPTDTSDWNAHHLQFMRYAEQIAVKLGASWVCSRCVLMAAVHYSEGALLSHCCVSPLRVLSDAPVIFEGVNFPYWSNRNSTVTPAPDGEVLELFSLLARDRVSVVKASDSGLRRPLLALMLQLLECKALKRYFLHLGLSSLRAKRLLT